MAAVTGWLIIAAVFSVLSAALLSPVYWYVRRRRPQIRPPAWVYAAAIAACSVALWYLVPLVVWWLFGRPAHP